MVSERPNGVLLTENLSRGVRFTRVRVFIDMQDQEVVYRTADFHKPWNIGVTPDPTIQARINQLNEELRPILATQIGTSSRAVPRSDSCGRVDGRLCESLVGQHRHRRDAAHASTASTSRSRTRAACAPT